MRLLDRVGTSSPTLRIAHLALGARPLELKGPGHFAGLLARCGLRLIVEDDLTALATELAYADGCRLARCVDLIRVPAPALWVEWRDGAQQQVLRACGQINDVDPAAAGRRVAVLASASACGRSAVLRSFWSDGPDAEVELAALETHLDFGTGPELRGANPPAQAPDMYADFFGAADPQDPGVDALLGHARFRFDPDWAGYYRRVVRAESLGRIRSACLATVARDVPYLIALFLLLNAREATSARPIGRAVLNRARAARGLAPLLDHVEVRARLPLSAARADPADKTRFGRHPRLHAVRGHLVRRGSALFWRRAHLRGSALRGRVRSRTVRLSFD